MTSTKNVLQRGATYFLFYTSKEQEMEELEKSQQRMLSVSMLLKPTCKMFFFAFQTFSKKQRLTFPTAQPRSSHSRTAVNAHTMATESKAPKTSACEGLKNVAPMWRRATVVSEAVSGRVLKCFFFGWGGVVAL